MKKNTTMEKIAGFEQAQEDYAREQFRTGIVKDIKRAPAAAVGAVISSMKSRLEFLFPSTQDRENAFKAEVEKIADDLDIHSARIPEAVEKLAKAAQKRLSADVQDVPRAYAEALAELEDHANPFNDSRCETALTRFMQELQLTGGPGKTRYQVLENAQRAAMNRDPGALQFWHKNLEAVFNNAEQDRHDGKREIFTEDSEFQDVKKLLWDSVKKHMSFDQIESSAKARTLRRAWEDLNMDSTLQIASILAKDEQILAGLPKRPSRARTPREDQIAEVRGRVAIAQEKAEAEKSKLAELIGVHDGNAG